MQITSIHRLRIFNIAYRRPAPAVNFRTSRPRSLLFGRLQKLREIPSLQPALVNVVITTALLFPSESYKNCHPYILAFHPLHPYCTERPIGKLPNHPWNLLQGNLLPHRLFLADLFSDEDPLKGLLEGIRHREFQDWPTMHRRYYTMRLGFMGENNWCSGASSQFQKIERHWGELDVDGPEKLIAVRDEPSSRQKIKWVDPNDILDLIFKRINQFWERELGFDGDHVLDWDELGENEGGYYSGKHYRGLNLPLPGKIRRNYFELLNIDPMNHLLEDMVLVWALENHLNPQMNHAGNIQDAQRREVSKLLWQLERFVSTNLRRQPDFTDHARHRIRDRANHFYPLLKKYLVESFDS